jgi:prephenate dehydratase
MRIAIQGGRGSFHHQAALQYRRGETVEPVVCRTFRHLCERVLDGTAERGLMAVENSLAGGILANLLLLNEYPLHLHEEIYLRVDQHLLALPGEDLGDLRTVYSHPMALLQCSRFLSAHAQLACIESWDTADSAREIRARGQRRTAAIAGRLAANLCGLAIVAADIQDHPDNFTRFVVLGAAPPAGNLEPDKASLNFRLDHRPGTLAQALDVFRRHELNLTLIQSLPVPENPGTYSFHIDVEWDRPTAFQATMAELAGCTRSLKLMGTYVRGRRPDERQGGCS